MKSGRENDETAEAKGTPVGLAFEAVKDCQLRVRWPKIATLRMAIASGTYQVSAEELADCLLRRHALCK